MAPATRSNTTLKKREVKNFPASSPSSTIVSTETHPHSKTHSHGDGNAAPGHAHVPRVTTPLRDMVELILCVIAIYVCYLAYGILHEKMTRQPYGIPGSGNEEKFKHSFFLTTAQCVGSMLWAVFLIILEARRRTTVNPEHSHTSFASRLYYLVFDNVPKHKYALVATSYTVAMISSTSALSYISYPVQALAKSSKLIPVMVGRILGGAKYSQREYLHVLAITGGISLFFLAEQSKKAASSGPESSITGVLLLLLSLTMDAITGPTQDSISETYHPAVMSMTFWINFFPAIVMGAYISLTGELASSIAFCQRHPEIVPELIMYCVLSAFGQSVIVWALFRFNSMTVTVITTTRKFCSILASVVWFQNTLGIWQWVGVLLVFAGIGSDSQYKYAKKKAQQALKLKGAKKVLDEIDYDDFSSPSSKKHHGQAKGGKGKAKAKGGKNGKGGKSNKKMD